MEGDFKIIDKRGKRKEESKESKDSVVDVRFEEIVFQLAAVASTFLEEKNKDLKSAKHFIDLLDLLEKKTKNNLTQEEEKFLKETLTHLKMEYVKHV